MKRHNQLWQEIISFENLFLAHKKARLGKRQKEYCADFDILLEIELFQLQKELREKTYQPGAYKTFEINEPKKRQSCLILNCKVV